MLDNAKYQKYILVAELATQLKIELHYLPSYSPNLNIIERLWKYGLNTLPEHKNELDTLCRTLIFSIL